MRHHTVTALAVLVGASARAPSISAAQAPAPASAITLARQAPDSLREQLRRHLAQSTGVSSDAERRRHLKAARDLAGLYAAAWHDSVLLRQVDRFERWPARDRSLKVSADSLRRAGFEAFPRAGAAVAMRLWQESRRQAAAIGDSLGLAATLGNLGAGFLALGELDSARLHLARARTLAERTRDWRTLGNALGTLGALERAAGNRGAAGEAYRRALAVRSRSGDDRGAAADENNLGLLAEGSGDTTAARAHYRAALARNRRAGRAGAAAVNLVNLANLEVVGLRYANASTLYREALALHRQSGERAGAALDLRAIGGLELRQGKYRAAITAFAEAASILAQTGPPAEAVAARADLAEAHAALGDLESAIRVIDRADGVAREAGPGGLALLALVRGDLARDAGTLDEAQAAYQRAESLYVKVGDARGTVAAQEQLGMLQLQRGDYRGAVRRLEAAALAQRAAGDDRGAALTELDVGRALLKREDTAAAIRSMQRARSALQRLEDPVGVAAAFGALGDVAEQRGRSGDAEAMYRAGLGSLARVTAPAVEVELRWGLGRALKARGLLDAAARELLLAVNAHEQVAGRLTRADLKSSLLGEMAGMYADLALVEHARGRDAVAFETSERLRGRQMRELVGRGLLSVPPGADPGLIEQERRLRDVLDELERNAPATAPRSELMRDPEQSPRRAGTSVALAKAQSAYAALMAQLTRTAPGYVSLLTPPRVSRHEVASHLGANEALLEYLVTDSTTLLFVVTRDSIRAIPIGLGRRDLAASVEFARAAIMRPAAALSPEPWALPLRRLHRLLIQPAEASGALRGIRTLVIAPHGELHYLPFGALMPASGPRYLIERYDIAYVPSAAIWAQLGARARSASNGKVLVVAPFPRSLPGSRNEAAGIGRVYGRNATIMMGPSATEPAFARAVPSYSIVHLATFGVLNRQNPLFSYVAFAPDPAGGERLEVQEVFGLSLRARLLVLSACETGLGSGAGSDVPPGDDWVGLVRAFLFAGADNVMATLWPIEDRSTSLIIPRFYRALREGEAARSLAVAQRAALRDPATAAPRHWSAFVLVGAVR